MNYNKYFELAKEEGIESLELYIVKRYNLSISLFQGQIDSFTNADTYTIAIRGIYHGKMGYAYSEKNDRTTPQYLIDQVKENAKVIDNDEVPNIFKGSEKYFKKNVYNPKIVEIPTETKIALLKEIENGIKNSDSRITESTVSYEESIEEIELLNSYGLKLKNKSNYVVIYADAVANDSGEIRNSYDFRIFTNFDDINPDAIIKKAVQNTLSQFGGKPCASGKYKAVLSPKVTASLLGFFLTNVEAEQVQKNTSLLKDKLNQLVCSKKVTIQENPLTKNAFFRYFDDEGVATYNKKIVEKGVLKTYLYNLTTAAKDNVISTGNGYKSSVTGKVGIGTVNVVLKPGRKSEEELFAKAIDGIYITDVQGLHAGMNSKSGNFSLQAAGYLIKDGKKAGAVSLITIAGNLFTLFKEVKEVASNLELQPNSISTPSILIKKLSISGL